MMFRKSLDSATTELRDALPQKARSWGVARKCLNIFLRDAFYTCYLREEYDLNSSEPWYELPLDRVVVKEMRTKAGRGVLPWWPGVKYLKPENSSVYQAYALKMAEGMGISRVHLDTYLWVDGRKIKPGAVKLSGAAQPATAKR